MKSLTFVSLALAAIATTVSAEGINCEGSGWCAFGGGSVAQSLADLIQGIDDNAWYNNGDHIACSQADAHVVAPDATGSIGFCAFLQNTAGTWGSIIKQLAPYIPGHGCRVCGSVPYYYPQGNNNVDDGELTFNMVTLGPGATCTEGLC